MRIRRLAVLTGVLFLSAVSLFPVQAEEKADERKEAFDKIKKEFADSFSAFLKTYREAKTPEEKKAAIAKMPKSEDYAPRVFKLVEADPKSDDAFNMLTWVVQNTRPTDSKVFDLLAKYHAKNPKIKTLCQRLMMYPPAAAKSFFQAVLDNNEDQTTRGYACFGLANAYVSTEGDDDKADPAAEKAALKYFRQVVKEFGDLKVNDDTLGKQADKMIREFTVLAVGMKAPDVEGKTLDDKTVKLDESKGKVVVLDIWATWCGPCKAMIPHEREMVEKLKDKPFKLISISADEKKEDLEKFLEKEKMPWEQWWAGREGEILKTYNVRFFPTIYVIDAKGIIRYKNIREKKLEEAVEKLLAEAGAK